MKNNQSEKVLYRKYRPNFFKEVLGQEHVVRALSGAINLGNISHAYLFAGSRGTGKTSVARILAQEVGCSGNDLYEIDAASNRGIDDIRDLRDSVNTLPFNSKYKVYIIDEVHMLTKEAFNALLKTLEEPPSYVIFILATTELDKLPETIISRCQTFNFKKPNENILKEMVLSVAKKEGFEIDIPSADLIAVLGDGSFRDTHGILQKIISSTKDKKIEIGDVEVIAGAPRSSLVNDFILSVAEKNPTKGLEALNKAVQNNIDMKIFAKLILQKLRVVLLLRFVKDMRNDFENNFSQKDFELLLKLSESRDGNISSQTIKEMLDAYEQIGKSYISQLPLELFLAKI